MPCAPSRLGSFVVQKRWCRAKCRCRQSAAALDGHSRLLYGTHHCNRDTWIDNVLCDPVITARLFWTWTPGFVLWQCKVLLTHGANVNARQKQQKTALHFAAAKGNADLVQFLLSKVCPLNIREAMRCDAAS
jgi:hypothetical protein